MKFVGFPSFSKDSDIIDSSQSEYFLELRKFTMNYSIALQ